MCEREPKELQSVKKLLWGELAVIDIDELSGDQYWGIKLKRLYYEGQRYFFLCKTLRDTKPS